MGRLADRHIVLGVSGGIAAYKSVEVLRRLRDEGAHVVPVMTRAAARFIGRTTLSALASEPVQTSMWDGTDPIPHTRLGQRAELVVVAPATARVIAAYAHGLSTDLLTSTLIATRAPVVVAPAMHTEMWEHPAVADNVAVLRRRGVHIVGPGTGRLAGGDAGVGRMAEPDEIVSSVLAVLSDGSARGPTGARPRDLGGISRDRRDESRPEREVGGNPPRSEWGGQRLDGLAVLVTAGGTREPIDPVRVIANRSSGKQGHAIAAEAAARGARVVLVTTAEQDVAPGIEVVRVDTAADMEAAVGRHAPVSDIVVMAAAVADFRPKVASAEKLKKRDGVPEIVLEPTPDILAGLAAQRRAGQTIVGFAAETGDVVANASAKLAAKGVDMIVANDVTAPGAGFAHDTNAVTIIASGRAPTSVALAEKRAIAARVLDAIVEHRAT